MVSTPASRTRRRGLVTLAVTTLCTGILALPAPGAGAASARVAFPDSVPAFVAAYKGAGTAATSGLTEGEVFLPLRDEDGARALATAVSTPGDPQYGAYLSASAWLARYAPSKRAFETVRTYLLDQGLTIYATPASREYLVFQGSAEQVRAAFGTSLRSYVVRGRRVTAPSSAPSLPASIARLVSGIDLGTARAALSHTDVAPRATAGTRHPEFVDDPCSDYWDQRHVVRPRAYGRHIFPTRICGYKPGQLRSASGVNKQIFAGQDGTGQTVAVVGVYGAPKVLADTNRFSQESGSPLLMHYREVVAPQQLWNQRGICAGNAIQQTTQIVHVQNVHAIAPGAAIVYVGGFNCSGGQDIALSKVLDAGLANIVNDTYQGFGEAMSTDLIRGQENMHIQAAGEGIGLYFAGGDNSDGTPTFGYRTADYPASSPWVTSVGGTVLAIGADGQTDFETGWGDALAYAVDGGYNVPLPGAFYLGSAGGTSSLFTEPSYQQGVVPDSVATAPDGTTSRATPDIADDADPQTGISAGFSPILNSHTLRTGPFQYRVYGGTDGASALAAGKMALVQAATGRVIGFANPLLYDTYRADPATFNDALPTADPVAVGFTGTVSGNKYLLTLNADLSLMTTPGYDLVTGMGSLDEPALVAALPGS